jgi:hypothetical protein
VRRAVICRYSDGPAERGSVFGSSRWVNHGAAGPAR